MSAGPTGRGRGAERLEDILFATWVSLTVNLLLSIVQVIFGWLARSQALLADGLHSFSDLLSDVVVLVASRKAEADPDEDHPYGHRRYENAATGLLGVLLLSVGAGMFGSAALKLGSPAEIPRVDFAALVVALICLASKEGLFHYLMRLARRHKSNMLAANAWHSRSDAASSLVVALGILGNLLGYVLLDALAAAIVAFLILRMGWRYVSEAFAALTDKGLSPAELATIRRTLNDIPGIEGVHELKTRRMGDYALVDVHLEVAADISVSEGHWLAEFARARLRARDDVIDVQVHVDPGGGEEVDNVLVLPSPGELRRRIREIADDDWLVETELFLHYRQDRVLANLLLPVGTQSALRERLAEKLAAIPGLETRFYCRC